VAILPIPAVSKSHAAADYRARLRAARENPAREERARRDLLIADNSTRAAA
jgi:hypothetical protein